MNRNYRLAKEYFNLSKGWVLHHKNPKLKYENPERYNEWRIEDLIPMEKIEHIRFHNKYFNGMTGKKHTKEEIEHLREINTGEGNGMYGKTHSEETKEKMRQRRLDYYKTHTIYNKGLPSPNKGKHWKLENGKRVWYTDGKE